MINFLTLHLHLFKWVNRILAIPRPWAMDSYWSVACSEPGHTAGVSGGQISKVAPHHPHYCLSSTSWQMSGSIRFS